MTAKERMELTKEKLRTSKRVVVSELSSEFGVTEETIRRDLEKLENEGIVNRTFGGAVLNMVHKQERIHFYQRATIHLEEKKKMAKSFEKILADKVTIAADASSTVIEVLKLLQDSRDITVLTTSTEVFSVLADTNINVISTGGVFNKSSLSLQGKIAQDTIERYHVDLLMLSCNGLDLTKGATDSNEGEASVKKMLLGQAKEVALFVDHHKFNKIAFTHLLDFEAIDYLVTDKKPDNNWIEICEANHVKLFY